MNFPGALQNRDVFKQEQNECAETAILAASLLLGVRSIESRDQFLSGIARIKSAREPGRAGTIGCLEVPPLAASIGLHAQRVSLSEARFPFLVRLCWAARPELNLPERVGLELARAFANGYEWHVVLALGQNRNGVHIFDPNFSLQEQPAELDLTEIHLRAGSPGPTMNCWKNNAVTLSLPH